MLDTTRLSPGYIHPALLLTTNAHEINALIFAPAVASNRVTISSSFCAYAVCLNSAFEYDLSLCSVDIMIHNRCSSQM